MLALIAFDGASPELLDELIADGRLPHLERLRAAGDTVPLETPAGTFTAAAYPTAWTGLDVTEHGQHYPFQWSPERQRVERAAAFDSPPAMWERLAGVGRVVLVVDPYEGRPPERVVDTVLSGWQFTNRVVLERWSSPRDATRRWQRRLGCARPAEEVFGTPTVRGLLALRQVLLGASSRAADLVEAALAERPVDLLVVSLSAVHLAGHQFWDPRTVLEGAAPAELLTTLRDVYAAADGALGRIVDALPTGSDVIVFSALGMDRNHSLVDLLPGMVDAALGRNADDAAGSATWRFRAAVPTRARAAVADALPSHVAMRIAARLELRGTDWSTTRAFVVPSDAHGYVRLNLKGRERDGIVDPRDADGLSEEIVTGLSTFTDENGEPVVEQVRRTSDVVPRGSRSDWLPDLIVSWRRRPPGALATVRSPLHGTIPRFGRGSGRSGNHTDVAWALVVPGASRPREPLRPARVTDLAATVAALHGLETAGEPLLDA